LTTRLDPCCYPEQTENMGAQMVPVYAARIEDLGPGDFVKVDCAACRHTALLVREADRLALRAKLAPAFLSRVGLRPRTKVLDLKDRVRCRGCGARGRAVVSIKLAKSIA
jgi:ribosomal protein S27E